MFSSGGKAKKGSAVCRIILNNALVLLSTVKTEYVKFKEKGFKLCLQLSCEHINLLSFKPLDLCFGVQGCLPFYGLSPRCYCDSNTHTYFLVNSLK